jgi:conjugative transfer signal peptidase TraF
MIGRILTRLGRRRRRRARPRIVLAIAGFGLGLIGFGTLARPAPWLVWNVSASAPIGLYHVVPGSAARGDLVLAHAPESVRQLADERHYLPSKVPLVKRIAAARGDTVCAAGNAIFINGRLVAERLTTDRFERPLPNWSGCHLLENDKIFLLMEGVADSFDSRYFGPIPTAAIIGRLVPLWIE